VLAVALGPVQVAHRSESDDHVWLEPDDVEGLLPLHPAFRAAWQAPDGELRTFVADTAVS